MIAIRILALLLVCTAVLGSDEGRLMKTVMEAAACANPYGVLMPVANTSQTMKVKFGIELLSIDSIDRQSGMAEFTMWDRYSWNDKNLRWNPKEFGGIDVLRIPMVKEIWKPDLFLYNTVGASGAGAYDDKVLGVITSDGTLLYIPPVSRKVKCAIEPSRDGTADVAQCNFKFGSWTFDGYRMDFDFYGKMAKIDLADYISDSRFEVITSYAKKAVKYYPCCKEPYPSLTFTLEVKLL